MSVTVEDPSARVCAGVDWAKDDHAVCVVDADGEVLDRFTVEHTAAGLKRLIARLLRAGVVEVGIERGDGPVVEALLAAELVVFVIAPSQLKNLRSRYGSAGNKDDRYDAYVLADVVRTDRRRLSPLTRSTPATIALRSTVRARRDLVEHRVAAANQLRAHLQVVFPGAVGLFAAIDSATSLAFLHRFTTQAKADWLTPARLGAWLTKQSYSGRVDPHLLHQRLLAAPAAPPAPTPTPTLPSPSRSSPCCTASTPKSPPWPTPSPSSSTVIPTPTSSPRCPARRHPARRPAARRDRRRPQQVPHRRLAGLPGRSRPLDPPIRQNKSRHLPLVRRQRTPRRTVRLRRRLPPSQPLGRRPLPTRQSPRARPPPRRTHPRPRLGQHHLALLARPAPLRPRPPQRTPTSPHPAHRTSRLTPPTLTQGNSSGHLVRAHLGHGHDTMPE